MTGRTIRLITLFLSAFALYAFHYGDLLKESYAIAPFQFLFGLTALIVFLNAFIRHPGWNLFFDSVLATVLISFSAVYSVGFVAFDRISNERFYLIGLATLFIASVLTLINVVTDGRRYHRHVKEGTHESKG
ncbi:MAG: hypothetical protein ACLFTZ_01620 [Acholeplasmataceae bacterium]